MTIQLKHFDAKLRLDLNVREPLRNCLAEYLFPKASFALGEVDPETVKASDLREYGGMALQFASGQRMYFSDSQVGELLYPNPSDRIAYPKGVIRDILPIAREQARELSRVQGDVHTLAQTYVRMYGERRESPQEIGDLDVVEDDFGETERESQEQRLYEILKADLSHHGQLLEHPNTIKELREAVQNLWRDIALARSIRVQSALAQPCLDLKENEVCVPKMPDGMELIVTRSPLVNSNGVIVLTNRHLPQLMRLEGTIHIHPETAAGHLQADFDGDRLAFERADRFPNLVAEIKEALKPENRYPDVVKRAKVPYQGTIEEIAVSAVRNDIGKIANQIMGAVSLRWETTLLPEEEKSRYVNQAVAYYQNILARDGNPDDAFRLSDSCRKPVMALASLTPDALDTALQHLRDIQFKVVSDLSNELQVAVDGPKSALRPDQKAIAFGTLRDRHL